MLEDSSRERRIAATSSSSLRREPFLRRTWMRAAFSPSLPVCDSDRPAPPTMPERESMRGSSLRTAWTSCTKRSVASSGVPSGSSTRKLNSPCEKDGMRSTPRVRAINSEPMKAASATVSTVPGARSAQRSTTG